MAEYAHYSPEELRYFYYDKGTKANPFALTNKMLREGQFFTNGSHLLVWCPVTEHNACLCRVFSLADGSHIHDFVTDAQCFPNLMLGVSSEDYLGLSASIVGKDLPTPRKPSKAFGLAGPVRDADKASDQADKKQDDGDSSMLRAEGTEMDTSEKEQDKEEKKETEVKELKGKEKEEIKETEEKEDQPKEKEIEIASLPSHTVAKQVMCYLELLCKQTKAFQGNPSHVITPTEETLPQLLSFISQLIESTTSRSPKGSPIALGEAQTLLASLRLLSYCVRYRLDCLESVAKEPELAKEKEDEEKEREKEKPEKPEEENQQQPKKEEAVDTEAIQKEKEAMVALKTLLMDIIEARANTCVKIRLWEDCIY